MATGKPVSGLIVCEIRVGRMDPADDATGDCVASLELIVGFAETEVCVGMFGVQFPRKTVIRTIQRIENRWAEQTICYKMTVIRT